MNISYYLTLETLQVKTVKSSYGNIDLDIPRHRQGALKLQALKKYIYGHKRQIHI